MNGPHLHCCSVPECRRPLPVHVIMCRGHWKFVPYPLRAEVYRAWQGYCEGMVSLSDLREVQQRATEAAVRALAEPRPRSHRRVRDANGGAA